MKAKMSSVKQVHRQPEPVDEVEAAACRRCRSTLTVFPYWTYCSTGFSRPTPIPSRHGQRHGQPDDQRRHASAWHGQQAEQVRAAPQHALRRRIRQRRSLVVEDRADATARDATGCGAVRGPSLAAPAGSPPIGGPRLQAAHDALGRGRLARLEAAAGELGGGDGEVRDRLAVQADAALLDAPTPLASASGRTSARGRPAGRRRRPRRGRPARARAPAGRRPDSWRRKTLSKCSSAAAAAAAPRSRVMISRARRALRSRGFTAPLSRSSLEAAPARRRGAA